MSLLKYFKHISSTPGTPKDHLPDISGCLSEVLPSPSTMACNVEVSNAESSGTRKPLTPVQRFEIGKKSSRTGTISAMRYFAKKYAYLSLIEPTVR